MQPAGGLWMACSFHRFCYRSSKSNDVVTDFLLDFVDSIHRKAGVLPKQGSRPRRDLSPLRQRLAGGQLDLKPLLELVLFTPDMTHLGPGITLYHNFLQLK